MRQRDEPPSALLVKRLRRAREFRGLTQDQLATMTGLTRSTLAMVETGQRARGITIDEAVALCRALEVDLCRMLDPEPVRFASYSEWN